MVLCLCLKAWPFSAPREAGPPWDSRLQPLVAEAISRLSADAVCDFSLVQVVSRSREGLLEKIGKAYKVPVWFDIRSCACLGLASDQVVSLSCVAAMLGIDAVAARTACESRGWAGASELRCC